MSQRSFRQQLDDLLAHGGQVRVARAVGVSPQTISDWKHGRRTPKPHHVQALEAALDLEVGMLSHHLGYVALAAEQTGTYEADLLLDTAHEQVRRAVTELSVPLDELVDDVDTFTRDAAALGLRLALAHLAVDLFEREHGALTEDELAAAEADLDAATAAHAT